MGRRGHHTYEQLHNMIIEAAFDILKNQGIANVSTRKISKQIGYTVGTLYIIFKNQEEIYLHINSKTIDLICNFISSDMQDCPKDKILEKLAESYHNFAITNFNLWQMLFEYTFAKESEMPRWYSEKILELDTLILSYIKQVFPNKSDQELMLLLSTYSAAIHGTVTLAIRGKLNRAGLSSAEDVIKKVVQLFESQ